MSYTRSEDLLPDPTGIALPLYQHEACLSGQNAPSVCLSIAHRHGLDNNSLILSGSPHINLRDHSPSSREHLMSRSVAAAPHIPTRVLSSPAISVVARLVGQALVNVRKCTGHRASPMNQILSCRVMRIPRLERSNLLSIVASR
jgi:hypothetical protein